jgi:coenzyme F420-reducing hydrogenase beta subunit
MTNNLIALHDVVDGGFCVGCGACAIGTNIEIKLNQYGEYQPDFTSVSEYEDLTAAGLGVVCPSLNPSVNENEIGKRLFSNEAQYDEKLGYTIQSYAGYVKEGKFRSKGTSGGMGTWILAELLRQGLIDGVIHVKESERSSASDPYYVYGISNNLYEIQENSKTRYHVVEFSQVLEQALARGGRYAFVGVPCMVKALRRLQIEDEKIADAVPFAVALVCGHLKSVNWSNSLAWGAGINPENARHIQYRTKGPDIPARAYVFQATDHNNKVYQKDSAEVVGGKFNAGALMLPACEFCDDVVGETSDLTIGDAWLPRFESDSHGTNLLVVRNVEINRILKSAASEGRISIISLSNDEAASSQSGGFRQRREGLSYRLQREGDSGRFLPVKRVNPSEYSISNERKKIYDLRTTVTIKSRKLFFEALEKNDYGVYVNGMNKEVASLRRMEIRNSFFSLFFNKVNRKLRAFFRR